jgi:sulfonate transport system substrate-binding protein
MKRIAFSLVIVFMALTSVLFADDKKLFTIRMPTQTGFNEFDVADELGYFKEEGLQLKYIGIIPDTGRAIQACITNNNDVFTDHPNSVVKAKLAGVKVIIISPGMVDHPVLNHMNYFVKADGSFQTADDIRKKPIKVAVSGINSCTDLIALEWARINNVPTDNLQFVIMPDDQQEQALKQGLIDLADLHPPFIKKIQIDGGAKSLFNSWQVVGSPAGGSSIRGVSEKFAKEHPNELKGFVKSLIRAHHWINANQQEAIKIIAKRLGQDPAKMTTFFYDENDWIQDSYIQAWISAMERQKQIENGKIKPSDIYTNAFNPYWLNRDKSKNASYKDKNLEAIEKQKSNKT